MPFAAVAHSFFMLIIYHSFCRLFFLLIAAACATLPANAQPLPTAFGQALQTTGIPLSALSLQVQNLDGGAPLLLHNAGKAMQPASIMKLVTTQAALELLGPDYRWVTHVYADGVQSGDTLQGDLLIKGSGDPRFAQEDLWRLLRRLRALGIRHISGSLILDRSLFQPVLQDATQFDGREERPYNALPDALLLDAKAFNLHVIPDVANQRVQMTAEPLLAGMTVIPPQLSNGECGDWRKQLALVFEPRVLRFAGSYAASCGEQRFAIHAQNLSHAEYFDAAFRQIWKELGGTLAGGLREGVVPASARDILQWQSVALSEQIRDINKFSNNVMARQLLLTMAAERGSIPATAAAASALVQSWLTANGIPAPELVLENGSGLSRNERVSATTMARVLQRAWRSSTMPEFMASLPIAGIDGTMKKRVQSLGVMGNAHIKTGSLADVFSMAGYVTARSGRRLLVVCIVNHANAGATRAGFDLLLQWIYENG